MTNNKGDEKASKKRDKTGDKMRQKGEKADTMTNKRETRPEDLRNK